MNHNTYTTPINKNIFFIINAIMGIYTIKVFLDLFEYFYYGLDVNNPGLSWSFGEFLINYQGGFVRRGLLGEMIYLITSHIIIDPLLIVGVFCALCVVIVFFYFASQFKLNGICWWILPLNFCLANMSVIRKDYFFVVSLIIILYLYKCNWNRLFKIILINIVAVFSILSHESFFLFCIPFLCCIIIRENNLSHKTISKYLICLPMILAICFATFFHGDSNTPQLIADSWSDINKIETNELKPHPPLDDRFPFDGVVNSISWSTKGAISLHLERNFLECSFGIPGFVIRPLTLFIVFYFILNFLSTFSSLTYNRTVSFTRVFTIQFLSLLPLFTFLSCDTYRIYFYWFTSSFVFFFFLDNKTEITLYPQWYRNITKRLHDFLTIKLKAPVWLIILLLFTLSTPNIGNNLVYMRENNVIAQLYRLFYFGVKTIL